MRFALCATHKRKHMKSLKTVLLYSLLTIILIGTIYYIKLPSYTINSSTNMSASNYVETSLDVQVYKEFGGKSFYEEIADNHNRLNGKPDRLEMNLYLFNYCYRTVIFDYEEQMAYIYVGYLPRDEE